jgi:hypothetical protein
MASKTFKQWMVGGPPKESSVDMANRLTKEFIDFHNKKFEKPPSAVQYDQGSKSEADKVSDEQNVHPM